MFVALVIQHAKRLCLIVLSSLFWSSVFFPTLSHKRQGFRKKKYVEYRINIMFFSANFVWKSFRSKKNSELSDHKCIPVCMQRNCFSSQILMKLEWSQQILEKILEYSWKSAQWEPSCFIWTDRETDMFVFALFWNKKLCKSYKKFY